MAAGYKFYLKEPLIVNKPAYVVAKDEQGIIRGIYNAYYRPEQDKAVLYPRKGSWIYGNYSRCEISIFSLIRDY
jgi:hypothetical protein